MIPIITCKFSWLVCFGAAVQGLMSRATLRHMSWRKKYVMRNETV